MKGYRVKSPRKKNDGKREAKKRLQKLQRRVFESLDLPEELLVGVVKATLYGKEHLLIENHKGVLEYGTDKARVVTEMGVLCITGQELILMELGTERICVRGRIDSLAYEGTA
ncbi:MAG: YabP/YqfC family sporulation protein [Clostridia bacterium]|nr:YabP/YqfC family sporulation protein [Clostridia bacterium]